METDQVLSVLSQICDPIPPLVAQLFLSTHSPQGSLESHERVFPLSLCGFRNT